MRASIESPEFGTLVTEIRGDKSHRDIEAGFRRLVLDLSRRPEVESLLEVGGGRRPLLTEQEVADFGGTYTVNDVDPEELTRAPAWVSTLTGNISDERLVTEDRRGRFDLIFSQWVFEHVQDPAHAYANILQMLAPGGICINMVPTLYASPFVINRIVPEKASAAVLKRFFPHRDDHAIPKFPAYYRWCRANRTTRDRLLGVGFASAQIVPFYGHGYYATIPVLRELQDGWTRMVSEREWQAATAYAVIIVQKGTDGSGPTDGA